MSEGRKEGGVFGWDYSVDCTKHWKVVVGNECGW